MSLVCGVYATKQAGILVGCKVRFHVWLAGRVESTRHRFPFEGFSVSLVATPSPQGRDELSLDESFPSSDDCLDEMCSQPQFD